MNKNSLKQKLINNELTIGSWISIAHPNIAEIMATANFEWLVVDLEHTSIDLLMAQTLISTIQSKNIKALVRVSKNEEVVIKKVLDMGADGVIVPMVNNEEDAKKAVSYAKYPPIGKRGVGLYRAQNYGLGFEEYKKWVNEEMVIIAQIEHIEAVENIDSILKVDGIDGTIIGPYDLSGSMGFPGDFYRDDVKDAISRVKQACKIHNKPYGFHVIESNPASLQARIDEGCTFLAYSIDFLFLGDNARYGKSLINNHTNILYDKWHKQKKIIEKQKIVLFEEKDIVFVKMGKNIGIEQNGKGDEFLRAILIYKKFNKEQFLGFPLTSKEKNGKFYFTLHHNDKVSYVLLSQIKTFSAKRIKYKMGKIGKQKLKQIHNKFVDLITPSK